MLVFVWVYHIWLTTGYKKRQILDLSNKWIQISGHQVPRCWSIHVSIRPSWGSNNNNNNSNNSNNNNNDNNNNNNKIGVFNNPNCKVQAQDHLFRFRQLFRFQKFDPRSNGWRWIPCTFSPKEVLKYFDIKVLNISMSKTSIPNLHFMMFSLSFMKVSKVYQPVSKRNQDSQGSSWIRCTFPSSEDTSPTCSMMAWRVHPDPHPSERSYLLGFLVDFCCFCGCCLYIDYILNPFPFLNPAILGIVIFFWGGHPHGASALWYCKMTSERLIFVAEKAM